MAIHKNRRVQRIIEFVGAGVGDGLRFVPGIGEDGGLVHHHHRPHLVPDGTDFKPGDTVIKSASRRIRFQVQPAEPVTAIVRPRIIMHAGADERRVGGVAVIKGVRRAGEKLVLRRGRAGQSVVALGQFLEKAPAERPRHAIGENNRRQPVLVVHGIEMKAHADLTQIAGALRPFRGCLGAGQGRQYRDKTPRLSFASGSIG